MLVGILPLLGHGTASTTPQDHARATLTKKFTAEDAFVTSEELAQAESGGAPELIQTIHRKIRAFDPEPGAWTIRAGKRVKLLAAKIEEGRLVLTRIQEEGKNPRAV